MHFSSVSQPDAAAVPAHRGPVEHLEKSAIYRDYREAYETATGLPLALRAAGSFQLPLQHSRQANPFCRLMAATNQTCAACLRMQPGPESVSAEGRTAECLAGLVETSVPVRVGERVLGYLQTGQVRLRRATPAGFRKVARRLSALGARLDLAPMREAWLSTRVLTTRQYRSAVQLVSIFARQLSDLSNRLATEEAAAESPVIAKAKTFIAANHAEPLSLDQVAHAVSLSTFHLCKLFKAETGLNFTEYVGRVRVEAVKRALLNPHTRVSEAAFAAGFQSIAQFNRVFRRVAGEAPSIYRERLHGADAADRRPFARAA